MVAAMLVGTIGCDTESPVGESADEVFSGPAAPLQAGRWQALDDDEVCTDNVGEVVDGNVIVPDGMECTLEGSRIDGNVLVGIDATLVALGVTVEGNIQAEGARAVIVGDDTHVDGNIQIKYGGSVEVLGTTIRGDLQFEENADSLTVSESVVGGNLQVFKNSGDIALESNQISGDLQCKENDPAPVGGGNTAASKEDQCFAL